MKLAIFGGSAPSTPHLFLCNEMQAVLPELDVTLIGRSADRLSVVARAVGAICDGALQTPRLASFEPSEVRESVRDADAVLVQVRCGGYAGRAFDETFPLGYSICGDEGLGPGGLSAAWRAWPELLDIFGAIQDACPRALVVLLTSPVSVLVRCIRSSFPELDVIGICELPWTTLRRTCEPSGVDPLDVSFSYAGVNHLGWFSRISAGSRDVLEEFRTHRSAADGFPSSALVAACGGIPLKYLRLHYEADAVVREQQMAAAPRGAELEALQSAALEVFASAGRSKIEAALASRPTPWYEHAVGPLLGSIAKSGQSTRIPLFLSVPNRGLLDGFEDDDILEIAHRVEGGLIRPIAQSCAISAPARHDLERFVRYERAAARAVLDESIDEMAAALECHPWVPDGAAARSMAADIASSTAGSQVATAAASLR